MVIVDTSVSYKWFATEEIYADQALNILQRHLNGEERICIPDFMLLELANAWSTKSKLTLRKVKINLKDFEKVDVEIEPVSLDLIQKAIHFSRKYRVTVYDAIYAVLAKEKKCSLITADDRFAEKVGMVFVRKLKDV